LTKTCLDEAHNYGNSDDVNTPLLTKPVNISFLLADVMGCFSPSLVPHRHLFLSVPVA